jgi:choline dehydrogenase-like flavoprotein
MLVDLQEVQGSTPDPYATVCIAGAGIAGLVLATNLADAGISVTLLEAGGLEIEGRSQDVYDAEMADRRHAGTTEGRFRVFGGSSVRWGGQLLPYTEDIFSPVSESVSGWPISSSVLEGFYSRAEAMLGANHLPFTSDFYRILGMKVPGGLDASHDINLRVSKWAPFSHRNVARTLGKKALSSDRITVVLHANVTECRLSPEGTRIEGFAVRNYRGARFEFRAEQYVVAAGTIETSRLLLLSRSVCAEGVGNDRDQVGRGFYDHVGAAVAEVHAEARRQLISWLGPFFKGETMHTGRLEASISLRRRLDLLAVNAHMTIEEPEASSGDLARKLIRSIQRGNFSSIVRENYSQIPMASLQLIRLAYYWKVLKRRAISKHATVRLNVDCEQRAHPQNRIRLSTKSRDLVGLPKAVVDWRVSSEEIRTIRRYAVWLREELSRLGVSKIKWHLDSAEKGYFPEIRDTNHPMGGTIMGTTPSASVVDTNLCVHGVPNLYLASCSTYPCGGSSNPTFSLIALSLRLGEHVKHIVSRA